MTDGSEDQVQHFQGYISVQHTVWCGTCGQWEQHDIAKKSEMIKHILKRGWKRHKEAKWQCPKCVVQKVPFNP